MTAYDRAAIGVFLRGLDQQDNEPEEFYDVAGQRILDLLGTAFFSEDKATSFREEIMYIVRQYESHPESLIEAFLKVADAYHAADE